jgi:hypothetical protein
MAKQVGGGQRTPRLALLDDGLLVLLDRHPGIDTGQLLSAGMYYTEELPTATQGAGAQSRASRSSSRRRKRTGANDGANELAKGGWVMAAARFTTTVKRALAAAGVWVDDETVTALCAKNEAASAPRARQAPAAAPAREVIDVDSDANDHSTSQAASAVPGRLASKVKPVANALSATAKVLSAAAAAGNGRVRPVSAQAPASASAAVRKRSTEMRARTSPEAGSSLVVSRLPPFAVRCDQRRFAVLGDTSAMSALLERLLFVRNPTLVHNGEVVGGWVRTVSAERFGAIAGELFASGVNVSAAVAGSSVRASGSGAPAGPSVTVGSPNAAQAAPPALTSSATGLPMAGPYVLDTAATRTPTEREPKRVRSTPRSSSVPLVSAAASATVQPAPTTSPVPAVSSPTADPAVARGAGPTSTAGKPDAYSSEVSLENVPLPLLLRTLEARLRSIAQWQTATDAKLDALQRAPGEGERIAAAVSTAMAALEPGRAVWQNSVETALRQQAALSPVTLWFPDSSRVECAQHEVHRVVPPGSILWDPALQRVAGRVRPDRTVEVSRKDLRFDGALSAPHEQLHFGLPPSVCVVHSELPTVANTTGFYVETRERKVINVHFPGHATVLDVKVLLLQVEGVAIGAQVLLLDGRRLENAWTLNESGVRAGDFLDLVLEP